MTIGELRPYLKRVAARHARNPSSEAWSILRDRWETLASHCRDTLAKFYAGQPASRTSTKAADQIRALADNVSPDEVIRTALAIYLMAEEQPRRFRSDRAFEFQLVRRVRGLTAVNAGSYFDQKTNRPKRVYRDLPPRVVVALAGWLKDCFGAAGVMLARVEERDRQKRKDEGAKLAEAIRELE